MGKSAREWLAFLTYEILFLLLYLPVMYVWGRGLLPGIKPGDPGFSIGFALGFTTFLFAATLLRLSDRLTSLCAGRQRFDLCSVEALNEQDPSLKRLYMILLSAIRDRRTRLRLEPNKYQYRVYGTINEAERELAPLVRKVGDKVIAAMKIFAGQNAECIGEVGVQIIPILVAGNAVTLSTQSLTCGDGEGLCIGIEDHTLNTTDPESEKTEELKGEQESLRTLSRFWEGCEYIDEVRQELQAWASQVGIRLDQSTICGSDGPGRQAEGTPHVPEGPNEIWPGPLQHHHIQSENRRTEQNQ